MKNPRKSRKFKGQYGAIVKSRSISPFEGRRKIKGKNKENHPSIKISKQPKPGRNRLPLFTDRTEVYNNEYGDNPEEKKSKIFSKNFSRRQSAGDNTFLDYNLSPQNVDMDVSFSEVGVSNSNSPAPVRRGATENPRTVDEIFTGGMIMGPTFFDDGYFKQSDSPNKGLR